MGQNQSVEEPYHKRHYNLTNQQIQRQNSFSQSTPNLLLRRDGTFQHNNSTASLIQNSVIARRGSASGLGATTKINTNEDSGAGSPKPFIRLLPIANEVVYFDESDESEDSEESDQEEHDEEKDKPHRHNRGITASPSFLEGALNANTRLSRSDSYENYPRDRADFQRTKEEEQEDLSYLSPASAQAFDHDHPRYFNEDNSHQEPELKRYQLYDPPVSIQSPTKSPQDIDVQDLSISSRNLTSLDVIREEDENISGHSKNPSLAHVDQQDRETSTVTGLQPLQEANGNIANADSRPMTGLDMYDSVKIDLDRRIQEAVQNVEQQLQDRVQKLEQQTASLSPTSGSSLVVRRHDQEQDSLDAPSYHSRGSAALRKEMISSASQKVDDLDSRVNQMEYLVSFKLNDIENKVQELHEGHNAIAQTMDETLHPLEKENTESKEMQVYRQPTYSDTDGDLAIIGHPNSSLVDKATIAELRQELQAFGMRYHELNDGLLTDLMGQLREAKLMLFDNVDEVDKRLGLRVDRIEAEMHAQLLSDIENRIQERVRAMEQTSIRLETCFDKMEGRLGALETVLASKRPRPESVYHMMQQQQHQNSQLENEMRRAAFLDPNYSPESPMPDKKIESNMDKITPSSTSNTISDSNSSSSVSSIQSISTHRNHGMRPSKILTSTAPDNQVTRTHRLGSWQASPQSVGPFPTNIRRNGRAMTMDSADSQGPFSASLPGQHHTLLSQKSLNSVWGPKSAGFATPSSTKPPKTIRRPSSYKELLHFWKAGESTPDLLKSMES
ncbi:hypothetical protein BGZ49_009386 [Haplosporangium sp. Z 27]|nr:hypothetical protein BGZ49_009386 [Haplosporangium sp. Z 27]